MNKVQKQVGLSFAGGGVHSWATVAAYENLEKNNIDVTAVTGTSMGSFLAAAVACELYSQNIYNVIYDTDKAIGDSKLFNQKAMWNLISIRQPMGLVLMDKLKDVISPINPMYSEVMMSDVPKPLAITSVDAITGKLIIFSNKPEYFNGVFENAVFYDKDIPLVDACLASSAYPIVLSPVEIDNYQLIDGGVMVNSPSMLFSKEKIDYVIALRTGEDITEEPKALGKRLDVGLPAIRIMIAEQVKLLGASDDLDFVMRLNLPGTFEFGDSYKIIEAGKGYMLDHPIKTDDMFHYIEDIPTWKARFSRFFKRKKS